MVISNSRESEKKYFMGVDVGGTKILICITDIVGNIVYRRKISTTNNIIIIKNSILTCLEEADISIYQLQFISFGIPGTTDSNSGVILDAPSLGWINFPFKKELMLHIPIPVYVNNDVNCAALGEKWLGAAKNMRNFVFIAIGTGVGGAIVANDSLIQGEHFMAGEVAYFILEEDFENSAKNTIGQFGLFEQKTSGTFLAKHGVNPKQLFSLYKQGDQEAVEIINEFLRYLSIGLSNVVSLLNPEKIILGGGVSQSLRELIPLIEEKIANYTPIPVAIEQSKLGEIAGAIGAIAFGLENKVLCEEEGKYGEESIT
ncbi:ROK family protein [Fredinandcohnia sp. 179-A 10B2 NHS]|uniref:ROK family protein n=1 Tax=Fredinandcohnia sp. 179-A 10B2 NHS TaxID=3235176 RepID=UPI0039A2EAA7